MPDVHSTLAPMSEAITNHIRVEVLATLTRKLTPLQDEWVFQYTVQIPLVQPDDHFTASLLRPSPGSAGSSQPW